MGIRLRRRVSVPACPLCRDLLCQTSHSPRDEDRPWDLTEKLGRTPRPARNSSRVVKLCLHRHRCGNLSAGQGARPPVLSNRKVREATSPNKRDEDAQAGTGTEDATSRSRFHSAVLLFVWSVLGGTHLARRSATQMNRTGPSLPEVLGFESEALQSGSVSSGSISSTAP